MKLSHKLSLSSGFLTLLVAAGVIVGIYSMKQIGMNAEGLTGYSVPGIIESQRLDTIASDMTLNTIRHVYTEDAAGMRRREQMIDDFATRLAGVQQRYMQSIRDEANRRLWDAYMVVSRELAGLRNKALELSRQGKMAEALEVLDGPYQPVEKVFDSCDLFPNEERS